MTWSLAVEEQFDLAMPLLIRFVPTQWLLIAFGLAVLSLNALAERNP